MRDTRSAARTLNGSEVFRYAGVSSAEAGAGRVTAASPLAATAHASPNARDLRPGLLTPLPRTLAREGAKLVFTIEGPLPFMSKNRIYR
ncbi:hypothetical protein O7628_22230 [Micromonospora sp. WMMD956]|uniref:hypothetical protein n=1 Tax=Micromonospora TaxID=1873 RepID=UPI002417C27E|nr:hypothetical protein [Micromonospora sp. WMMD956]MDG4818205.1 hypothetical protein [Micromonospora sp. WMMD956]